MIVYFYISIVILIAFAIFQFSRIFTISRRSETTHKFIPITFTLIVGVVLFFAFPVFQGNDNFYENLILYEDDNTIIITNDNYDLLQDILNDKELYNGKNIVFLGFVEEDDNGNTILSRELINCCQADKKKIQIRIKGMDIDLNNGQWIRVCGRICFDDGFYIKSKEYKLVNKPQDIYFHEKL